jgi:hypothetical protein
MRVLKGKELEKALRHNHHCKQALLYDNHIIETSLDELQRIMKDTDKKEKYRRREKDEKSVLHWGQRKLFLAELEFLTMYANPNDIVVYVGSAPGNHTYFLTLLFPFIRKFILIDPSPFYAKSTSDIEIIQDFFKPEHIEQIKKEYSSDNILFISDIRSACPMQEDDETVEMKVKQDMQIQMDWVLALKPRKSMLKFRLPWESGETEYLDGDIYYQPWAPSTSTETRLITDGTSKKMYSNRDYEQRMFYFNTHTRTNLHIHSIEGIKGLDYCYDCATEVYIWKMYLEKYGSIWIGAKKRIETIISRRNHKSSSNTNQPSDSEIQYMKLFSMNPLSIRDDFSLSKSKVILELMEAIILTHSICSIHRTFTSKISSPEKRKWYKKRIFKDNEIVYLED